MPGVCNGFHPHNYAWSKHTKARYEWPNSRTAAGFIHQLIQSFRWNRRSLYLGLSWRGSVDTCDSLERGTVGVTLASTRGAGDAREVPRRLLFEKLANESVCSVIPIPRTASMCGVINAGILLLSCKCSWRHVTRYLCPCIKKAEDCNTHASFLVSRDIVPEYKPVPRKQPQPCMTRPRTLLHGL